MRRLLVHGIIDILSLGLAARLVEGVDFPGNPPGVWQVIAVVALFGVLKAVVRPLLAFVACGLYVITFGLFHFVVNAMILQLTGWLAPSWLRVDGFWPAFQAALIVSLVGTLLTWLLDPPQRGARPPWPDRPMRPGDVIDGE